MTADIFTGETDLPKPSDGMGGHQSHASKTDTWITPPHVLAALGPFDLDPCAALTMPWKTANRMLTREDNGLMQAWHGRVWLNPPYGNQAERWLAKLADHGKGTALIFARTETASFERLVWGRASALLFLYGRLTFHRENGKPGLGNAGAPSVLIAYGEEDATRLANCGLRGALCIDWRT